MEEKIVASVVMSTYNTPEQYLKEAINSILMQSFTNFELIVVDDGSVGTDAEIVKSFQDDRIVLLRNFENRGLAYSLNRGIDAARGKYIVRMDSDDIALPDRLKKQVAFMEAHQDIDILSARAQCFGSKEGIAILDYGNDAYVKAMLFFADLILHPTVVMRKSRLDFYRLRYDPDIRQAQDYDLWSRAAEVCTYHIMPDIVLKYRCHSKQATAIARDKQIEVSKNIGQRYCQKLGVPLDQDYTTYRSALSGNYTGQIGIAQLVTWVETLKRANVKSQLVDSIIFDEIISSKLVYAVIKMFWKKEISFWKIPWMQIITIHNLCMIAKHLYRNWTFKKYYDYV